MKPERFYQFLTHVIDLKRIASISDAEVFGLEEYLREEFVSYSFLSLHHKTLPGVRFGCLVVFNDWGLQQEYTVKFGEIQLQPEVLYINEFDELPRFMCELPYFKAHSRQLKVVKAEVERFREAWKAYQEALDHSPESA